MPGVPPNALPKLKSFLKGILRGGGGKKKQQQQGQGAQQQVNENTNPPTQSDPTTAAASTSKQPSAPEPEAAAPTSSTIPPTTDHADTQHKTYSQEALQQDPLAAQGAAPDPNVAGGPEGAQKVREQEDQIQNLSSQPQVSLREPTSAPAPSEPKASASVFAAEDTTAPAEETKVADAESEKVDSVGEAAQQRPVDAVPSAKENQQPGLFPISDEKMPVMAEPPTVNPVKAAPGMSATSGPLEDFPGGMGDK